MHRKHELRKDTYAIADALGLAAFKFATIRNAPKGPLLSDTAYNKFQRQPLQ